MSSSRGGGSSAGFGGEGEEGGADEEGAEAAGGSAIAIGIRWRIWGRGCGPFEEKGQRCRKMSERNLCIFFFLFQKELRRTFSSLSLAGRMRRTSETASSNLALEQWVYGEVLRPALVALQRGGGAFF